MKYEFKERIIYADTDAEGVVYYANYLKFFERGRDEFIRQKGISLKDLKKEKGILFAVDSVEIKYHAPARFDDEITITTDIAETTGVRIIFDQKAYREKELLVSAKISVFALDAKSFKPMRMPKEFK
jgi:acyl-CoA thioester hydrolase